MPSVWEAMANDDLATIRTCFNPLIQAYKQVSANPQQIFALYSEFNNGQQALFAVWTYLAHAIHGTDEFHWRTLYTQHMAGRYGAMQQACVYMRLPVLGALLHELAEATRPVLRNESAIAMNEAKALLAGDPAYSATITALERRLLGAMPETYDRIAAFIRSEPDDFVSMI